MPLRIRLRKEWRPNNTTKHQFDVIYMKDPHPCSLASHLLISEMYKLSDSLWKQRKRDGRASGWRDWCRFRNRHLKKQKKINKGKLACYFCHQPKLTANYNHPRVSRRDKATLDHLVAQSKGGRRYDVSNIVVACDLCNSQKGDSCHKEFFRKKENARRKNRRTSQGIQRKLHPEERGSFQHPLNPSSVLGECTPVSQTA